MSLARFAEDIARAVAGELTPQEETPLREHLRGCAECRGHYDALTLAARALKGATPLAEERRAEERLLAAISPTPVAKPKPSWRFAAWALGVPAAIALAMSVVTTLLPAPGRDVTLRGGPADVSTTAAPFTLQLFAKPKDGGALRLAAELPGSGEIRVTARDWLQVKFLPNPRGTRAFAVDAKGVPTALSESGSVSLAPGTYDVWGLHDLAMMEAQAIEEAKTPWPPGALPVRLSERAHVASGKLVVDP